MCDIAIEHITLIIIITIHILLVSTEANPVGSRHPRFSYITAPSLATLSTSCLQCHNVKPSRCTNKDGPVQLLLEEEEEEMVAPAFHLAVSLVYCHFFCNTASSTASLLFVTSSVFTSSIILTVDNTLTRSLFTRDSLISNRGSTSKTALHPTLLRRPIYRWQAPTLDLLPLVAPSSSTAPASLPADAPVY